MQYAAADDTCCPGSVGSLHRSCPGTACSCTAGVVSSPPEGLLALLSSARSKGQPKGTCACWRKRDMLSLMQKSWHGCKLGFPGIAPVLCRPCLRKLSNASGTTPRRPVQASASRRYSCSTRARTFSTWCFLCIASCEAVAPEMCTDCCTLGHKRSFYNAAGRVPLLRMPGVRQSSSCKQQLNRWIRMQARKERRVAPRHVGAESATVACITRGSEAWCIAS